jgi:hypothetical protein
VTPVGRTIRDELTAGGILDDGMTRGIPREARDEGVDIVVFGPQE